MPELPDITVYQRAMSVRLVGATCRGVIIRGPSVLRAIEPDIERCGGRRVREIRRLGKRLVVVLDEELFLVVHLMIAGRLLWKKGLVRPAGKIDQASVQFTGVAADGDEAGAGTVVLTEASTMKRAGVWLVEGEAGLEKLDPGGAEPIDVKLPEFIRRLSAVNRTLKRAMTDPKALSGIGNAYSDEILHAAKLSPIRLTSAMTPDEWARLHAATRDVLKKATTRLLAQFGFKNDDASVGKFPGAGQITAFRPEFAVHGKFGERCPACGTRVQRIVRAENEVNYCPMCQTGGKVLADRSMSRLLKEDWPSDPADWE